MTFKLHYFYSYGKDRRGDEADQEGTWFLDKNKIALSKSAFMSCLKEEEGVTTLLAMFKTIEGLEFFEMTSKKE